jgi:hypothetical protein
VPEPPVAPAPKPEAFQPPATEEPAEVEAPAASGDNFDWRGVLKALKGSMPAGILAMLSDPLETEAALSGDTLSLSVKPGFSMNNINRPDVTAMVARAASGVLGQSVRVKVLEMRAQNNAPEADNPRNKLDELGKFNIVSFK